jgi:hypothetical protein
MEKTAGAARRRQLFAAVSVLGVSLGMADMAHAATQKEDATTQTSHKVQSSEKSHGDQSSVKVQSSYKVQGSYKEQSSYKGQSSIKGETQSSVKMHLPPPGGQTSVKGGANQ